MNWGRYTELHPNELDAIRVATPIAYLPWGALEWHGPHLPLGVDGLIAEAIAERVIERTGGVLLPTTWWPVAALPHPDSLSVKSETMLALWNDIFEGLAHAGWHIVVIISGNYSHGHELILMDAAEEAITQYGLLVLALPPMVLIDESMLDHAALWETSLMLALYPDMVHMHALGNGPITPASSSVMGIDPRGTATASMGRQAVKMAVELITKAVQHLLADGKPASLYLLYERHRASHRTYIERYGHGSLEQANKAWWREVCQRAKPPKKADQPVKSCRPLAESDE